MATLVLGAIGSAVAGPVGGFISSAAGAFIDQAFIFPALFPRKPIEGPRIDDRQLQVASEGADMKWIIGPRNRAAGTVIWMSDLIEVKEEQEVGKGDGPTSTTYRYFVNVAIAVCSTEGLPGQRINRITKIWADSKVIYESGQLDNRYAALRIHRGDQTTPDPLIEEAEGVGNVPAFIASCYVVFERLALEDFGNRIPTFTFLVEQTPSLTTGEAIGLMLERWGFEEAQYDVDGLTGCFKGQIFSGPQPGGDAIQPVVVGQQIGIQEANGVLRFFQRGDEDVLEISDEQLAAREQGSKAEPVLAVTDRNDISIPQKVTVDFVSTENDLQAGTESESRFDHGSTDTLGVNLPMTMHPDEARATARSLLWAAEAERYTLKAKLPPSWATIREGQLLHITVDDVEWDMFVQEVNRGANFVVEVSGVSTVSDVRDQEGVSQAPVAGGGSVPDTSRETDFFAMDLPPLVDATVGKVGLYFGISYVDSSLPWGGASLYQGETRGGSFSLRADAPSEAVLGRTHALPGSAPPWQWDEVNTIVVELSNGSLASCSEEECIAGTNRAAILGPTGEWEVIGFRDVVELTDGSFRLSRLLRGLRGTEHAIADNRIVGAPFILLTSATIGFWEMGQSGLGTSYWYKAPARNGVVSEYTPKQISCNGASARPFSPTHLEISVEPANIDNHGSAAASLFTAASSDSSFNGPSGFFSRFTAGMRITTGGWANGANNGSFLVVSVNGDGTKMVVDGGLADESPGTSDPITFCEGDDGDIVARWRRRSKYITALYSSAPLAPDESPLGFRVTAHRGGSDSPVIREWTVAEEKLVYPQWQQNADGLPTNFRLTIVVRQVGHSVAESVPVEGVVVK